MQTASRSKTGTKKMQKAQKSVKVTLNKDGTPRKKYTLTKVRKSRSNQLLNHLMKGRTISGTQALRTFGIYRLSGIIFEFRKRGIDIETTMIKRKGRTYGVYKFTNKRK